MFGLSNVDKASNEVYPLLGELRLDWWFLLLAIIIVILFFELSEGDPLGVTDVLYFIGVLKELVF